MSVKSERKKKAHKAKKDNGVVSTSWGGGVEKKSMTKMHAFPPPEERLCRIHNVPIAPSRWRSGHRHTDCAQCRNNHPSKKRNNAVRGYKKIMSNRTHLNSRIYGFAVFERLTGFKIPESWKSPKGREDSMKRVVN